MAGERRSLKLGAKQHQIFTSDARFRVAITGRRFGKTHGDLVELITEAAEARDGLVWYVAPTYKMAKGIAWRPLKRMVPREWIRGKPNESDLSIELRNGCRIELKGAEDPDALRGPGLDFLVMDEFAWIKREAWEAVLRPMLAVSEGRGLFTTSPRGFNWSYDLFQLGQGADDEWESWQFTTLDGGRVTAREVAKARATMDARLFRQEFEASFEVLAGRVYDQFTRAAFPGGNVDASVQDEPGAELLVGMDFNVNPMSAVLAVRVGDECHVFDELEVHTSNTTEIAGELRRRYPERHIVVCPDPSGRARKTSAVVGATDFTILESFGFEVRAPSAAPAIVDRVNNAQANFCNVDGRRSTRIHPRCTQLIRCYEGLTYKKGTSIPDKKLGLDHLPDAHGYLLWSEFNLWNDRPWAQFDVNL